MRRRLATRARAATSWRAPSRDHGRIVLGPDLAQAIAFVNGYGPEHLSIDVADLEAAVAAIRNAGLDLRRALVARVRRRLRLGREPRPADGRPRPRLRAARRRDLRQVHPGPADHPRRPGGAAADDPHLAEAEGLLAHRDAVEARFDEATARRGRADEPEPVRRLSPTDPASYSWEATDEGVAERFGIPLVAGAALRPQHLARPARAGRRAPRRGPVRDHALRVPAGRLPEPRRGRRGRYGVATNELIPGAGADEILASARALWRRFCA